MVESCCMVLFSFFFLFSFGFSPSLFTAFFFCDSGFLFCGYLFFYKTLALKDSNTTQTTATSPHPWAPAGLGGPGPLGVFVAVFLVSGTGGQARGPGRRGLHSGRELDERTTKSRGPRRRTTLGRGPGTRRRRRARGEGSGAGFGCSNSLLTGGPSQSPRLDPPGAAASQPPL